MQYCLHAAYIFGSSLAFSRPRLDNDPDLGLTGNPPLNCSLSRHREGGLRRLTIAIYFCNPLPFRILCNWEVQTGFTQQGLTAVMDTRPFMQPDHKTKGRNILNGHGPGKGYGQGKTYASYTGFAGHVYLIIIGLVTRYLFCMNNFFR